MPDTILQIDDLSVRYETSRGYVEAVQGFSATVREGEIVAIVGESGSGKSTTAHSLIGLLPRGAGVSSGSARLGDLDLFSLSEKAMNRVRGAQIGFIPQDPGVALNPVHRVGDQIAEVLRVHRNMSKQDAADRAVEILDSVGIRDAPRRARQYPHELSGGMKQRVLIGAAMSCEPKLLIADEPTSALDVTVQARILDLIEKMCEESSTSMLLITHDLGVASDRADRILVMQQSRLVESGTSREIIMNPQEPYTKALFEAAPSLASGRMMISEGIERNPNFVPEEQQTILRVENVTKQYNVRGATGKAEVFTAVDDVSFEVKAGSTMAIVGESGSGKSTTARVIMRLEPATAGTIEFEGNDITNARGQELLALRSRLQMVYQNPFGSMDPRFTIEAVLDEPLRNFKMGDKKFRQKRAAELLDLVQLPESFLERYPRELSGGQRQRVAIGRAISMNPKLLVLDEAVSALDVSVQHQILQLLTDIQAETNVAYLFISHDLAVVRQVSDTVGVMQLGRMVESGTTESVFTNPQEPYTRELIDAIPGKVIRS